MMTCVSLKSGMASSGTLYIDQMPATTANPTSMKTRNLLYPAIIEFAGYNKFLVFMLVGFAVVAGIWSMYNVPLDAIPDLSDTQVIIYSRWDRSPDIMED